MSLTISCLTALQLVTENTPEITETYVKYFSFFGKTEYKFLINSPTKHDVSETATGLPKWKMACSGKLLIRPAAVNMRHAISHIFPGTDDQDKKVMTAANVINAYCSLGSHQRLFISEQYFWFSQGHMISFLSFISTLWGEKSA